MAGAFLTGSGFLAVIKHARPPLAGRGVDGRVLPVMLRIATHGDTHTERYLNVSVSECRTGLSEPLATASDGLRNGG